MALFGLKFATRPKLCTSGPWILKCFNVGRNDRFFCQDLNVFSSAAHAFGYTRRAGTFARKTLERLFDDAVLQRVERDDREDAISFQKFDRVSNELVQNFKLVIDRDTQCLEGACRRVYLVFRARPHCPSHKIGKLRRRFDRLTLLSLFNYPACDLSGGTLFAVAFRAHGDADDTSGPPFALSAATLRSLAGDRLVVERLESPRPELWRVVMQAPPAD